MTDRPTPLTDAWQAAYNSKDGVKAPTILEFMKQLERQNAELREALDDLQACAGSVLNNTMSIKNSLAIDLKSAIQNAIAALARKQP